MVATADQVNSLMGYPLVASGGQLWEVELAAAALIVEEDLQGKSLSNTRLDLIEVYLAAHYAVLSGEKGGLTSEKVGESENQYIAGKGSGGGLYSTRFGREAIRLDSSGTLAEIGQPSVKATFRVVEHVERYRSED